MIDLTTTNKDMCFQDSVSKPLYIFLYSWIEDSTNENGGYWKYFDTISEDIILESMELDEGILEGNTFKLGSFVAHSMKVQWAYNGLRYKDMVAVPVQKIGSQYIAYFDGRITEEEISNDGQIVTAKITSFLSEKLDIDVLPMLKQKSGQALTMMAKNALNNVGIDVNAEWFYRAFNSQHPIFLNEETLPKSLNLNNFLNQLCEFLGCHISTQGKRLVSNLKSMETYQPTGRINIDFYRLANVDQVSKSRAVNLPSGYKVLPYIQSTGSNYILTDYIPNTNTIVEMEFYNLAKYKLPTDEYDPIPDTTALFGSRTAQTKNSVCCFLSVSELNSAWFDYGNVRTVVSTNVLRKKRFYLKNGEAYIDKTKATFNTQSFSSNVPMAIFTVNTNGTVDERCAKGKLYSFRVLEGTTLKLNMIPCLEVSSGKRGLYDTVSQKFYKDKDNGNFISPNPIETYELPYYINSYIDKTNYLSIDQIRVLTETGEQLNYTISFKDTVRNIYEIKDNVFFEALSNYGWSYCEQAVEDVGSYLYDIGFYSCDLQTVYPLFIQGADYLILPHKNQKLLPSGYVALDGIRFNRTDVNKPYLSLANATTETLKNLEFSMSFVLLGKDVMILDTPNAANNIFRIYYSDLNKLEIYFGEYSLGKSPIITISDVPMHKKIELKIKTNDNQIVCSGTYNETAQFNVDSSGANIRFTIGSTNLYSNFEINSLSISVGSTNTSLIPCFDGVKPVFSLTQGKTIRSIFNYENTEAIFGGAVIPVLSCDTKGIHSIKSNIICKSTNIKN